MLKNDSLYKLYTIQCLDNNKKKLDNGCSISNSILLQILENNFYYFYYKLYLNRVLTHKHSNYKV